MNLPRGIRNNNPGNIRWGSDWYGLVVKNERTDPNFCQFKTPVYGLRAMVKIMFTYRDKYGLNTVESIINRYAPPNENNTKGYIDRICQTLGIKPNDKVDLTDDVLLQLVKAIVAVENGNQYADYYQDKIIMDAIQLARK